MENKRFLTAQDVMEMLGVSLSYSYKLIRRLNAELEADGFVTIKGRVSTQYFMKRIYGLSTDKEETLWKTGFMMKETVFGMQSRATITFQSLHYLPKKKSP